MSPTAVPGRILPNPALQPTHPEWRATERNRCAYRLALELTTDKAAILQKVCEALADGDRSAAAEIARTSYPFEPVERQSRSYTPYQSMRVFLRDGFIDRYKGTRLVCPPVLHLLGRELPDVFPAHPNWKMTETHMMFWELFPTIDHVYPIARGGADDHDNWVCTSMLSNQAKGSWTLDELGWSLTPPGRTDEWDGLTSWFLAYADANDVAMQTSYLKTWLSAARRAVADA